MSRHRDDWYTGMGRPLDLTNPFLGMKAVHLGHLNILQYERLLRQQ
jgi:hypothetical protein